MPADAEVLAKALLERGPSPADSLCTLQSGQESQTPWLHTVPVGVDRTRAREGLHLLDEHDPGCTGFMPTQAVVSARQSAPGPASLGLLAMKYVLDDDRPPTDIHTLRT